MKQAVQSLIRKIRSDAERHGGERYEQIKKDIDAEIEKENAFYLEELEKRREAQRKHNELEYARMAERAESRLHRELTNYQNELLDGIFARALEKLKNIPGEEFADMFGRAVAGLKGSYELYPGEYSAARFDARRVNDVSRHGGPDIVLNSAAAPHKSGFVLKNDVIEYNCLFEDLIEEKKSEQAAEIKKEVFGN